MATHASGIAAPLDNRALLRFDDSAAPIATNLDAALIDLAGRVERLSRRCQTVADRRATLEDRLMVDGPKRPVPPPTPSTDQRIVDTSTATVTTLTVTGPKSGDPAWVEWERVRDTDAAIYERDRTAMEERLGLSEVCSRHNRMWCRLRRWTEDLAKVRPTTSAGLAAKASAMLSLIGPGCWAAAEALTEHNDLALSILRDAVAIDQPGALA